MRALPAIIASAVAGSLLAGCAAKSDLPWFPAESRVRRAEDLAHAGRYTEAREAYERALAAAPGGEAARRGLLGLARLYVLADNPQRDYGRAGEYFERLGATLNASPAEALAWRDLLAVVVIQRRRLDEARRDAEKLRQDTQRLRQDLERLKQLESELALHCGVPGESGERPGALAKLAHAGERARIPPDRQPGEQRPPGGPRVQRIEARSASRRGAPVSF